MNKWTIYDKNGNERLALIEESLQPNAGRFVEPQLEYNGTWMGECFVTLNIKSPVPIKFAIGDYVMYRGERFVINYDPSVIKKATKKSTGDAFCYDNVKFSALSYELSDIRMLDFVIDGNNLHWNGLPRFSVFCPSIEEFADRLQANTDRWCHENGIGPAEKWFFITPTRNLSVARAASGEVSSSDKSTASDTATSIYVTAFDQGTDVDDAMVNQNVSIDNMTVWDAMKYIKETFGLNFIVRGRAVIIGAAGIPVDGIFQYGKDNGLYEIERVADSEQQIITKLFAYGTDKNLPTRYYADMSGGDLPNNLAVNALMLPGFPSESLYHWVSNDSHCTASNDTTKQATWKGYTAIFSDNKYQPYIQSVNAATLGIREATKYFDGSDGTEEVYPSITAFNTNTVYSAQVIEDAGVFPAGQEVADFTITLSSFGANDFVLSDYITAESAISMLDGSCGGRDFQIVSATQDEETLRWTLTCHRVHDESLDLWFPYSDGVAHGGSASASELYQIHSGDHFVFVGIEMPTQYVEAASERLLEGALQFLAKNDATRYTYIPKVDEIYMARQSAEAEQGEDIPIHDKIKEGGLMLFEDTDLGISTNAVFIDTLRIKEYGNQQIPTYEVTLRNEKQVGTIQRIQEQIGKITSGETSIGGGTGGSVNIPLVKSLIQTYGTDLFLRKDKESTAQEIIRFLKGIKFGSSNQWYINGDGEAVLNSLNVENLTAKIAHFFQLEIDEIKSVGGMIVISPSNATVYGVITRTTSGIGTLPSGWNARTSRLYFRATDGDKKIFQSFMVGDQILCQTFNAANGTSYNVSNKYYWSVVTAVSSEVETYSGEECHWIDVWGSTPGTNYAVQTGKRRGNSACSAGDEIVLLGNRSNTARQNAIVISAYDIDWLDTGYGQEGDSDYVPKLKAPFIVQYAGINDFNLYNKRVNVISHGYNVFKGDFKANTGEDLMETISHIEEGRLSFVHQAWAEDAVEITDPTSPNFGGWTLTSFNLAYFSGAKYMCFLSDHTEGEAHLNETIFSSAPQPSANPPIPKKNWMPVDFEIISEDYTYAITNDGNKPADSAFIYTESNLPTLQKGQYLWIKCDLEYSNGLTSTSYSVSNIGDDGEAGIDGVGSYLYIAYATSADGSQGFSKTDTGGKTYIGVYRGILLHPNDIPEDPDDYTLYTWSKYVGDAGLNGLSAPPAYKETTVPHYLVYASGTGVTKSTSGWVDNNAPALTDEKPYLWRYDTTTYENVGGVENLLLDSTNQFNYYQQNNNYIAKIKLAENLVNGDTYSLVFRAEDLSQFSITHCNIDIYLTTAWMAPGKSSSSRLIGQASYIHQEADGTCRVTFTAVAPDSTNKQLALYISGVGLSGGVPEVYWAMLAEGGVQYDWIAAPEDLKKETTPAVVATKGRGIGQIAEYYAKNNSNTTPPSGWQTSPYTGWSTTPVAADATNKYVWNFEVITYTDGTTVVTNPHVSSGYALGISNKTVTYAVTTSTSQPQDSAFTYTTVPTVNKGEYLWTKTEITYGDGSKSKSYSVSYKGTDGEAGADGRGVTGVAIAYQAGTSGTTAPTGTWKTTIPTVAAGQYLWTRSTMSFTSGSNVISYSVSKIGADGAQGTPGAAGADGQTTYLHIAYANSADGSVNFDTSYFTGATYIGTCTDYDESDPSTYSSYEWAELRGMDNAGVYVTNVKNYYKVTNTNSTPAIDNTWVLCPPGTIPQPTNTNRYLWNYEVTEYGCQYPNMVLNSDNPTIGGDPYLFRFNSTNEFVHGEVYSFAMKLGQLPSPKTYYVLQIQGPSYIDGVQKASSRAISQKVGQNPAYPTRLVPNEDGIITGTFECNLNSGDTYGDVDHEQHIWVSAYPEGGTYDVPSFDWITVVKGTQVASWSKALSELTQTIPPHLIATQGEKGDSAWVADLTNEMDSVQCDDTGYVVSQQSVSTALSLFYGVTEKNFGTPTVKRNGSTITIGTATNGVTVTYSNKVLTVAYDTAAKITGKDEFAITITASGDSSTVRTITFTVNGVKGDVYNLIPKDPNINATRDDAGNYLVNGSSTFPLVCGYTKRGTDGTITTVEKFEGYQIDGKYQVFTRLRRRSDKKWQLYDSSKSPSANFETGVPLYLRFYGADGILDHNGSSHNQSTVNINTYDAVEFVLTPSGYTNSSGISTNDIHAIDSETIYVVADGLKGGKGDFKATVFKRQNTKPSTPTASQGTYSNPVPDGWSDGIPAGGEMVWATTRTFKADDTSTTWSEPRQMTDTMTYDVEFAYEQPQDATPAAPTDANRHGGSGTQIWFDPALDTSEDYTKMAWRAERECANGVWGDWTIIRIKGEEGDLGLSAPPELTRTVTPYWALSASNTTPPAATSSDWGTSPVAPTAEKKYVWYYTKATYTGEEASRNMLRNSKNQWTYSTRSSIYIAKIMLWESLVAGQTYTITFYVDDLSSLSTGNVTVRTLYNSSAYTRTQATIKVHEGNLYKATFTADSATEATQVAIYIGVSNFTATSPETCPKVYWAMLTRGDVAYSWQAAPEEVVETTRPEIRTEKPDAGPQGPQGNAGRGIASGYPKEKYLLSNLNTGVTVAGNTWSSSILTPTEDKPYLWNYEETLWTDNTTTNSTPHILTTYTRAAAGDSYISGVYNWYVVTGQSSGVTRSNPADGTWVKCPPNDTPVPTSEKRYLWNYEETVWDAPEQGRNLIKSYAQSTHWLIAICTLSTTTLTIGATYTASIRLTVPANKTYVRFSLYGKINGGTSNAAYNLSSINVQPGTQTVTASFTIPTYTSLVDFRVYCGASGVSSDIAAIDWVKLEKGALPTPYSEAPENLTTYTDPHVVCIHGEDGEPADHYELNPLEEYALVDINTNGVRQLVVWLKYSILHVVGASVTNTAAVGSTTNGLHIRYKVIPISGAVPSSWSYFPTGTDPQIKPNATTYSGISSNAAQYKIELVKRTNGTDVVVDRRNVVVAYNAKASFTIDSTTNTISSIVQGSSQSDPNSLVNQMASVTEKADTIESKVQEHTTAINTTIPATYATQSSVTQTASSITSKVQNQMLNGANLLINSKDQTSGFDSSSSSNYDKTQTNTYYACYYFGADKPTAGDTFTVSWKQTNATGATKYRIFLFTDISSVTVSPSAINSNSNGYYSVTVSLAENFPSNITKVALYVSSGTPSTLANVEWAKAEYGSTASAWNPNISETGSEISQTANNILLAVEDVGININDKQITLNGNTQVNGTLKLDGSGDGFQLLSNTGTALITPESIGTYTDFQQTNKVTINPNFTGVREYIRENGYYRMGMSTQTKELGTFDAGSQIEVTHCSAQIYLYQNGYSRLTGTISGTISFYENNVLKETKTFPYTGTYTTQTTGDVKVLIDPVPTFFTVRQRGTGVPQAEADSYILMDTAYYAGNPNALWMIYMTFRVPVPGAYVRVASDGVGVKTSNGNTAYFGPSGMHISPLLQNVTKVTTTNYSASVNDDVIIVKSSSSSAVSITLPTGSGIPEGKVIYVKNVGQSSTCNVWAVYTSGSGSSPRMFAHDSNTASSSVNIGRKMSFFISFDTGSGIGWLQGYCST